jgi:hypothetical protein
VRRGGVQYQDFDFRLAVAIVLSATSESIKIFQQSLPKRLFFFAPFELSHPHNDVHPLSLYDQYF